MTIQIGLQCVSVWLYLVALEYSKRSSNVSGLRTYGMRAYFTAR